MSQLLSIPGPNIEHHGSISVPYEISIPKSDITSWPCQDQDCGGDDYNKPASRTKPHSSSRVETTTTSHLCSQRSSISLQSPYTASGDFNDTESGFESSSSSTTVTSWRHQRQSSHPHEDGLTDHKNVTVRSTWKTRGVASVEDPAQGRGSTRAAAEGSLEDDAENSTMWRAYRATTVDAEEINSGSGPGRNPDAQKGAKPSPAEVRWMDRNVALTKIYVVADCEMPFLPTCSRCTCARSTASQMQENWKSQGFDGGNAHSLPP